MKQAGGNEKDKAAVNSSMKKPAQAQPVQQKTSTSSSPQKKISGAQPSKVEVPGQKTLTESRKAGPQNQPVQTSQTGKIQGNDTASTQQESRGFFGLSGSKIQSNATKPAESVTGKMFGFGSSIFSSASTLISASAQDEPKTTPPVSPKMSVTKDSISTTAKKPDKLEQTKDSLLTHPGGAKPPSELSQKASASQAVSKVQPSACPLCKLKLNVGSKDPPNYNTCTLCKNTVCNQCGFNPMPNDTEVR